MTPVRLIGWGVAGIVVAAAAGAILFVAMLWFGFLHSI